MRQPALDHLHAGVARLQAKARALKGADDVRVHGVDVDIDLKFPRLVPARQPNLQGAYPDHAGSARFDVGVRLAKAGRNAVVLRSLGQIDVDVRGDLDRLKNLCIRKAGGTQ